MSGGEVKLTATEVIENLRAAFQKFDGNATEALLCADATIEEMRSWIAEKQATAERELADAELNLRDAERTLSSCQEGGDWDEDGNWEEPDCSFEESAIDDARSNVESANARVDRVKYWGNECERVVAEFQRSLDLFSQSCVMRIPVALDFLVEKVAQYRAISAIRAPNAPEGLSRIQTLAATVPSSDYIARQPGDAFDYFAQEQWADRYLRADISRFTTEERQALVAYQGDAHKYINEALWSTCPLDSDIVEQVELIDSALAKCNLPAEIRVIRGCDIKEGEEARVGAVLHESGFSSGSLSYDIGREFSKGALLDSIIPNAFSGALLDIVVPKGFPALLLRGFGGNNDHELEILMPRRTCIFVEQRFVTDGVYYIKGRVIGISDVDRA